ncbi:MAG: GFA family protein [Brevundimonas sp.]|uniref:GFA family protein n=1 Tax=Brevundimonas sp. TaxID=1871086 RepID=UPI0025BDE42C|nr:GFA family protein [Brevundimonas sp.]MBX3477076.1 GFA family protein [Brevundimonas sp.]
MSGPWREGGCHCGAVRFRVRLSGGLEAARRCSCSYCAMRGAVAPTARRGDLEVVQGQDRLATYRFNTGVAEHHFCATCGIYTHHRRRSNPDEFGVNAACLGISPFDFAEVRVNDGINHPSDGPSGEIGVLRFIPA